MKERILMAILVLNLAGCGGVSDQPELGRVTGTITFDGEPLTGIGVVFIPVDGRPAMATTDKAGKYELTYIRDLKGTKVGKNRVEIAPNEGEDEDEGMEAEGDGVDQKALLAKSKKQRIPAKYNTKSELEADVKPGKNVFDFKLESKSPK